jgi:protein TonB
MGLPRLIISLALASVVTVALFMLMQWLIQRESIEPEAVETVPIEITRAEVNEEVNQRDRLLERPDTPDEPPPPPPPAAATTRPDQSNNRTTLPRADLDVGNLSGNVVLDRDPQPIVRIPPQYPRRAAQRGLEGYVIIEFTIGVNGEVLNPRVVDSSSSVFESAALRAVQRWKYNPQIVNGQPIERPGIRVQIDFTLEEDD